MLRRARLVGLLPDSTRPRRQDRRPRRRDRRPARRPGHGERRATLRPPWAGEPRAGAGACRDPAGRDPLWL